MEHTKGRGYLIGPAIFAALFALVIAYWGLHDPLTVVRNFDANGFAPVELMAIPVFLAIVPAVWFCCPFEGSRVRRRVLCTMVSVVALMAVVKELDLHAACLGAIWPDWVHNGAMVSERAVRLNGRPLGGTPFKMPVLTSPNVPGMMKVAICVYFGLLFGTFAAGFAYLGVTWVKGVLRLDATSWCWGCCGAAGLVAQIADRLPSWLHHGYGLCKTADGTMSAAQALCTALEEGGELVMAILALLTIVLGYHARRRARHLEAEGC